MSVYLFLYIANVCVCMYFYGSMFAYHAYVYVSARVVAVSLICMYNHVIANTNPHCHARPQ